MVCEENQVQEGGSLCQGEIEVEESGPFQGEDIMAEVLDPDVFVDGVCTSGDEGIEENANGEDVGHGGGGELDEVVQEKEVKSSDGEKLESLEVGEVLKSEDGDVVGESSAVEDFAAVETKVVVPEEVREEDLKGDEGQNPVEDSIVGSSLVVEGSSVGETQVVVDKVSSVVVESLSNTTTDVSNELKEQKVSISDNAMVSNHEVETTVTCSTTVVETITIDTKCTQDAPEIVNDEDLNPEVDADETKPKSLDTKTQPAVEEEVSGKDNGNSVCSGAEGMDTDACDVSSADKQQSNIELGGGSIEGHDNALEDTIPSCQPIEGVEGENIEVLPISVEDQQSKRESLNEGSVHVLRHVEADIAEKMEADTQFTDGKEIGVDGEHEIKTEQMDCKTDIVCRDTDLDTMISDKIEEENASHGNGVITNFKVNDLVSVEKDQQLKSEECEDRSVTSDFAQLDSDIGQETEVLDQVTDAKEVKEQPFSQGDENNVDVSIDPVEKSVAAMDVDVLPGQNPEVQDSVSLDGVSPCSENDQILKAETVCPNTKIHDQVGDKMEMDTMSSEVMNVSVESQGPGGNNEQPKFECLDNSANQDLAEGDSHVMQEEMVAESQVTEAEHLAQGGQEVDFEEPESEESNEQKSIRQAAQEPGSPAQKARYELQTAIDGEFSVSDLVWGKVRSHPWWPGQIFDPLDSSEKAMKYHKKDCFLIAYFGDKSFAWNEASLLKPFHMHFSQIEKQSNSEAFQNAVDCALEEVSRRVELGLACSCIPSDVYGSIKYQVVENAGIREESSKRDGVDKSASASSFEPGKLVEYVKALAQLPSAGADLLELVIAKAQLLAFSRFKGYSNLPELQYCGTLLENGEETSCPEGQLGGAVCYPNPFSEEQRISETQKSGSHKRKHNLRDMYLMKKERSLSELMEGTLEFPDGGNGSDGKATSKLVSPTSAKKQKTFDSHVDDIVIQDGATLAKVSNTTTSPRQSFKIGECIQRAATHLTGPSSIIKCSNDRAAVDGFGVSLEDLEDTQGGSTILLDELLSHLHLAAQAPFHGHSFSNIIVSFFSDFRDSVVPSQSSIMEKGAGKRKMPSHSIAGYPETFEFVDMNDSYWTDMVVQNGSLEQLARKGKIVPVALEPDKSVQSSRRPYKRKRYHDGNNELSAEALALMDEKKRSSPAEIIMTFPNVNSVPSETSLSKIFRRFGPLKESETMVDRETCRARVVYKNGSDAEVAYSSAGKFTIFGPLVVTYQLNFSPFEPFRAFYTPSIEGLEEATLYLQSQS